MTTQPAGQIPPEAVPKVVLAVADLTPDPDNARRHSPRNLSAIAASLDRFGQRKPIVIRSDGTVIAGNGTLEAAISLGWEWIECQAVPDEWDDDTCRAFALADNRTAELAEWDPLTLEASVTHLRAKAWDMTALGFTAELGDLRLGVEEVNPNDFTMPEEPRTKPGDIWQVGPHRLICGDAGDPAVVDALMAGTPINLVVTSPPYAEQREYDEKSGFKPIPPDEYVEWFKPIAANIAAHIADDGSYFLNIKPSADFLDTDLYVFDLVLAHAREWGWHFATEFCWERNGVPQRVVRRFKNQFEPVYQFVRNDWKMRPDAVKIKSDSVIVPLGKGGGNTNWAGKQGHAGVIAKTKVVQTTLTGQTDSKHQGQGTKVQRVSQEGMAYPGNRLPTFAGTHEAVGHGAAFPVGLPRWFVNGYTDEGDSVFDPFMGSGSTMLAAHMERRIGYGVEISPGYCDMILARVERVTGITAEKA